LLKGGYSTISMPNPSEKQMTPVASKIQFPLKKDNFGKT
jgi:hypothetical protein